MNVSDHLNSAIKAAIAAGDRIMEIYNDADGDFGVTHKADNSPLTRADRAAHQQIVEMLTPLGIPILSEEGAAVEYSERREWSRLWIVDPLDGTKEFIKRNGEFTVNIALVEDGVPTRGVIYVPVSGALYFGEREIGAYRSNRDRTQLEALPLDTPSEKFRVVASRSHMSPETEAFVERMRLHFNADVELISKGSSLKICLVVEGSADVYPRYAPTMEWDTAAGDAIARAVGMQLSKVEDGQPLKYNKEELLNPFFITR